MNQKKRDEFWKGATEITGAIPYYRFHDEWYYIVADSGYRVVDVYSLRQALDLFQTFTEGEGAALYLYRGREHLATYNGFQSEPEGETTYQVTKSALGEWLAALTPMR